MSWKLQKTLLQLVNLNNLWVYLISLGKICVVTLTPLQVTAWSLDGQWVHGLDEDLLLEIHVDFLLSCVLPPCLFLAKMWRYNSDIGCCLWSHLVVLSILCLLHTNMSLVLLLVCDLKLLSFFLVLSYAHNISSSETACYLTAVCFRFICKDRNNLLVIVISSDSVHKVFFINFVVAFLYCTYMLLFCLTFLPCVLCKIIFFPLLYTFPVLLSELFVCLLPQLFGVQSELDSWHFPCVGRVTVFSSVFADVYLLSLSWRVCHDMFLLCYGFAGALKPRRCCY